jgi:hypothetical protein
MTLFVPKNNPQSIQYHAQRQVIIKIELSGKKVLGTNSWHTNLPSFENWTNPWIEVKWGTNYKESIGEKLALTIKCFNAHCTLLHYKWEENNGSHYYWKPNLHDDLNKRDEKSSCLQSLL